MLLILLALPIVAFFVFCGLGLFWAFAHPHPTTGQACLDCRGGIHSACSGCACTSSFHAHFPA